MRRKHYSRKLQPIGEILFSALKKRGMSANLQENKLFTLWPKAVGAKIAAQTQPDGWRAGTLFVKTTSSIWVQQLHFMKEEIRQKMNELAGKAAIRDIHFAVGFTPVSSKAGHSGANRIILKDSDKKMIAECTDKLADRELAAIVGRVMKKEISRRRWREKTPDR